MDTATTTSATAAPEVADTVTVRATGGDEGRTTVEPGAAPDRLWEELVTSALLGTDRRTPTGLTRPTGGEAAKGGTAAGGSTTAGDAAVGDAAGALLDAAALHTVRRRAGLRPGPA
ncbi:hypothetical protein ABGT92_30805, partial [Streptomyces cinereoruber]